MCPAITVNGGLSPEGLPLGLQMVAPQGQDYELMQLGRLERSSAGTATGALERVIAVG